MKAQMVSDGLQMEQQIARTEYEVLRRFVSVRLQHEAPAEMATWADAHPEVHIGASKGM